MSVEHLGGNRYKIYVELGNDDYGKRRRRTKTVIATSDRNLRKQELEFELQVMQELEQEQIDLDNITFSKFFQRYWDVHVSTLEITTRNNYAIHKGVILDYFGKMKLRDIKRLHIEEFFIAEKEAERKSLITKLTILQGVFGKAIEWEVRETNPTYRYKLKNEDLPSERIIFDTEQEIEFFYDKLDSLIERDRLLILAASLGALRRGEVLGIGEDVMNYQKNTISIERALKWDSEKKVKYIGSTKGKNRREIIYPEQFMKDMRVFNFKQHELRHKYGDLWELVDGIDLTFRTSGGRVMHPNYFTELWGRNRKKLGLDKSMRLHDLRHTTATYLVRQGMDLKAVQLFLGHSKPQTTINTYVHADKSEMVLPSTKLGKLL